MPAILEYIKEEISANLEKIKNPDEVSQVNRIVQEQESQKTKQLIERIQTLEAENIDFTQVVHKIEAVENHGIVLEDLKNSPVGMPLETTELLNNEIDVNDLSLARVLVERVAKVLVDKSQPLKSISSGDSKIHGLKKTIEREGRIAEIRTSILLQQPQNDFEANVKWMAEKGMQKELNLIDEIKHAALFQELPNLSKELVAIAESKIRKRLHSDIKYRIFCSCEELFRISVVFDNRAEIYITDKYPGFVMISFSKELSDTLISEIEKDYILEVWRNEKNDVSEQPNNVPSAEDDQTIMETHVVHFNAPMRESWRQALNQARVTILQPLSYSELIVSVPNQQALEDLKKLEQVDHIRPFQPNIGVKLENLEILGQETSEEMLQELLLEADKISDNSFENRNLTEPGILIAEFLTENYRDLAERHFSESGIQILNSPGKTKLILDLSSGENIREYFRIITEQPGLESVEEKPIPRLFNYHAALSIAKNLLPQNDLGVFECPSLTGEGEIIAIADSGLDSGTKLTLHPDFRGQVLDIKSYPLPSSRDKQVSNPGSDDGSADFYSGHGTHVAGSILGTGQKAKDFGLSIKPQGIAPGAKLFFQAIEQTAHWNQETNNKYLKYFKRVRPACGFWGIPDDIKKLFQDAYDVGARIHSNSWGYGEFGEYNSLCKDLDDFVWKNKDFLIVAAAGNDGFSGDFTVTPLGTAKNCLTVGASSIHSIHSVANFNCVADFSSRGPCKDLRLKPDLVAPGTAILSARSTQLQQSNHAHKNYLPTGGNSYMYMDGTSMATPLVAGCAALLRQYLRSPKPEQPEMVFENPSAALLKASLIHSTEYLFYPGHTGPWFDFDQGWGRINLSSILADAESNKVRCFDVNENRGVNSEKYHAYNLKIISPSTKLRVTLVYTDQSNKSNGGGNSPFKRALISNLNLLLVSPSKKHYCGNDQHGTGQPDCKNNVEGIILDTPEVGSWEIKIIAVTPTTPNREVPPFTQDYALVISGAISDVKRTI